MGKVLVIRFSSIGDLLLTTPVIRALSRDHQVHVATKKAYASLLEGNPHIRKLHLHQADQSLVRLASELRREGFDQIIDLHGSLRSRALRLQLLRSVNSYRKGNFGKWWMVRTKSSRFLDSHVVLRYFAALPGIQPDGLGLDIMNSAYPGTLPEEYNVLVLGAKQYTKSIPETLLQQLVLSSSLPCVLLGGPDDRAKGESVAASTGALNLAGRTSLRESAWVISRARRVVSPDTGLMHMAAGLGKPLAVLWGSTSPEFGFEPYFGGTSMEEIRTKQVASGYLECALELTCRPCSRTGFRDCPKGHFDCMKKQPVDRISDWLNT